MRYRGFDLVQFLGFILLCSFAIVVEASIHDYRNEGFSRRLNSYFHGGSEGFYASKLHLSHPNSEDKPLNGESFIRGIASSVSQYGERTCIRLPRHWLEPLKAR